MNLKNDIIEQIFLTIATLVKNQLKTDFIE